MKRKKKEKINLLNGCYHTEISVTPQTWQRKNASTEGDWVVWYRYYDPRSHDDFPNGKYVSVQGMNQFKDLLKRQEATRRIIRMQEQLLQVHHFNPITGTINNDLKAECLTSSNILSKKSTFESALRFALSKANISDGYRADISTHLPHILEAAKSLLYNETDDDIRVLSKEEQLKGSLLGVTLDKVQFTILKRFHIQTLLTQIGESKKIKWTNNNYNAYRKSLSSLFKYLFEKGYINENPIRGISKLEHKPAKKEILESNKANAVLTYLRVKYYPFFRFAMIYWKGGTRETELMRLKTTDVELNRKGYWATIEKTGANSDSKREFKKIDSSVLHLWKELVDLFPEDGESYVFSRGLVPGSTRVSESQITRRWYRLVKKSKTLQNMGIIVEEDFTSFRHANTTEVIDRIARELVESAIMNAQQSAAKINSHTSTKMVQSVYDVRYEKRKAELIRFAKNKLSTKRRVKKKIIIRF